jgi:hypothetical protein
LLAAVVANCERDDEIQKCKITTELITVEASIQHHFNQECHLLLLQEFQAASLSISHRAESNN